MYIKRVVIRGFKTYKNETVIEDFSPHHNVVVGRNGSGKSNFFAAIRFVLSDAYNNMSRDERQALIHESSVNIMSAFVEIIFDNSDRRIPIPKDEVSIRRTIGMKKDDYSLDYRSATKSDVMNLLEASGFSKSNPYYIVPQGKVTALTNAKDSERLELLKDIAGARVFENKLKDSLKEMEITAQKQEQIKEMVSDIEKRLDELNIEKEDFKTFERLNSKKKMLEFNIYDRELKALTNQIDTIENDYSTSAQETEALIKELETRESQIAKLESELKDLDARRKMLQIDLEINNRENQDVLQQISTTNIQLQDAKLSSTLSQSHDSYTERIQDLKKEINEKNIEVDASKKTLLHLKNNEFTLHSKIKTLREKQLSIISKKSEKSKYSSKEERNKQLKKEIDILNEGKVKKEKSLFALNEELKTSRVTLDALLLAKRKIDDDDALDTEITNLTNQISDLKSEARNLVDERSLLWRKESKINSIIISKEEDLANIEQSLRSGIDHMALNTLDTVKTIAKRLGPNIENGVFGYLGELIDVSEKYKTAVDVIGGSSLFHIVVNNDQTATILIEELKKEQRCRATFIPLNRLSNEEFTFPVGNSSVPLIKKIAFEDFLAPAVKQVFGRTVVCINLQKGYELANTYQVNAVTLDGDRCDNRGVLTGGFRDMKVSRIDYLKDLRTLKSEIYDLHQELKSIKSEINSKDFVINANFQKTTTLKNQLSLKNNEKNVSLSELSKIESSTLQKQQDISTLEQKIALLNLSVEGITKKIADLNDEIASPFSINTFTRLDDKELKEIHNELPLLEENHRDVLQKIEQAELYISSLLTTISEVLAPRLKKYVLELDTFHDLKKNSTFLMEDLESRAEKLKERKLELTDDENEINIELSSIKDKSEAITAEINELNTVQESFVKEFEDFGKSTDKNLVHRVRLRNRKYELERNIGELGVLPEETLTAFGNDSTIALLKNLTKVNENLKKYNHVNKKAMEQFSKFAKQKESLSGRISELDEAKHSIEHLIEVLQNRKNEAIIRAFKEVSVGFSKIFEQLVPAGKGRLIIQRKSDEQKASTISLSQYPDTAEHVGITGDQEPGSQTKSIESFIGISISVSFNSKKDEQQKLEQLSGGQKSLCALSLILAIQGCDPAPFYLFDEIDSNLDAQYRTAVANLIHKLSKNAQFICTTFRSEMLKVSDKFYGVMFNNKVSTISNIDAEKALDFVEDQRQS